VIYTDGLTEAQNAAGEYFGDLRLRESVQSCLAAHLGKTPPAGQILENLLLEIDRFSGGQPLADDLTLVVLVRE
jgi:sigma-B regulation protein RsbU (phosphoserine phosphatase)